MSSSGKIEHLGIVRDIGDKLVSVKITREPACGSCRVRSLCSIGDTGEKIIEAFRSPNEKYSVGEEIKVVLEQSLGVKALILGYVLPFLIVLAILVIMTSLGRSEGLAGLVSLASLVPYYLSLSLFKGRFKKEFSFRIKKL